MQRVDVMPMQQVVAPMMQPVMPIVAPPVQRNPDEIFRELQQRALRMQMEQDRKEADERNKVRHFFRTFF